MKYIFNFFYRFYKNLRYHNNLFVGNKFEFALVFIVFFGLFLFYFVFGGDLGFYVGFCVAFGVYYIFDYFIKDKENDNRFIIFVKYLLFRGFIVIGLIVFILLLKIY